MASFKRVTTLMASTAMALLASPSFADNVPADDGGALAEITVTATKRETNLQKTPIAISVVNAEMVKDRHVQSLLDLADGTVPSLRIATFEARQTALTIGIRGIVPGDANQPAREAGVGVYIDGVYLGRSHGLNAGLFDVERVEVLKGPQGTLFGRNTEGGALSIVTKVPSGEFALRATAGVGNLGAYNGDIHVDLPESGNFSFKFDGIFQHQNAYVNNPLPGNVGWGFYDRKGARISWRWKPTSNFTADFSFDYAQDNNSPFYSQLLNKNPNGCTTTLTAACVLPGTNPTTVTGTVKAQPTQVVVNGSSRMSIADVGVVQQESGDRNRGVMLRLAYKIAPSLELRSITAYRSLSSEQWDNAGGAHRAPVFNPALTSVNGQQLVGSAFSRYSISDLTQQQFSQEVQAVGSLPHVDYTAGLYYFVEKADEAAATPSTNFWLVPSTGTPPVAVAGAQPTSITLDSCLGSGTVASPRGWQRGCRFFDRASRATSKSYAAFGQFTWTPPGLDMLHITLGGRFTHDDKTGQLYIVNNVARSDLSFALKTNRFTPLAILAVDAADGINFYAKYSKGYRSGGASSRSINFRAFGPEDVNAYEIGAKTEFFNRKVRLNVAGYIMDRKNTQVDYSTTAFDPVLNITRNTIESFNATGITKIRGIEADLTVAPITGLTLNASYAYTYTNIPAVINPGTGILQKFYVVFTPRNAASGSIDYSLPVLNDALLKFHLDANYAQATQTFDQFATKNDPSLIVNGRISLADISLGEGAAKLNLSVWSRNLFNEQHVYRRDPSNSYYAFTATAATNINGVLGDYGNFNMQRTFGLEASIKF